MRPVLPPGKALWTGSPSSKDRLYRLQARYLYAKMHRKRGVEGLAL
jgi:hypothetical protein